MIQALGFTGHPDLWTVYLRASTGNNGETEEVLRSPRTWDVAVDARVLRTDPPDLMLDVLPPIWSLASLSLPWVAAG